MTHLDEVQPASPNVLFIITDQQRADHVGFAGNDTVRTPHLDSIAARGTVFDNAWVANPVCMPNRSSIMTGRMPSVHGVIFNDRSLEWGANTHVRQFRQAGYRTALIGKSHLQHGMSRTAAVESDLGPAVFNPHPRGWNTLEDAERYLDYAPEFPDSFYGFEHVELAIDHGSRISGHHMRWALDKGADIEELVVPMNDQCPGDRRHRDWWQIFRPRYDADLHSSRFVAERTAAFIEDASRGAQPWLAWASFPDPHHPLCPPGEWFDRHRPAEVELPRTVDDPLDGAPEHIRRFANMHPSRQRMWVEPCGVAGDHGLARAAIAATYGMVELIDDCVGQIVDTVDRAGVADNTIIVFTSDHGDMMGDHGLLLKGCMHYRGTLQVPMVIAEPGQIPIRTAALASSIDLGPTLLDMANLEPYEGLQGISLMSQLEDPTASIRDYVLIEDDIPNAARSWGDMPNRTRTLIAADLKYTRHSTGEEQLYNLARDPDELVRLSTGHSAQRAEMVELLADALIAADDNARGAPVSSE
ncbi:sulfatase [Candidatus Poriferisodalis sp.]|uniref:sulfatase family protein n=1 Tax=Candidatus Poriferisodalis sp. TaxID=3101277 RepID=UPI003B528A23